MSEDVLTLYAWLCRDSKDGKEGLIIAELPDTGLVPLVTTDLNLAMTVERFARRMAREQGHPAQLVTFERGRLLKMVTE